MPIPSTFVAHQAEQVESLRELFEDLQQMDLRRRRT